MVTFAQVQAARARIAPYVRHTETVKSHSLSQRLGTNVYLKLELFQKTGSFKSRAAFSKMLHLSPADRERGVVAVSGGNFAQGVAYAGSRLGVHTTIVMPVYTPQNYIEATRAYGAQVELAPTMQAAFELAEAHTSDGLTFMHPYDDPDVIAGNGSIGLELIEAVPQVTDVIVSVGGGGLMSGVAIALQELRPHARLWSVETEGADALARSLAARHAVHIQPSSLARTLGAPYIAAQALCFAQRQPQRHILVSDREAYLAQRYLLERAKVLTELASACNLAAAEKLQGSFATDGHLVIVLCGGNVSLDELALYKRMFE
jgi:threonine dehydratase